MSEKVGAVAVLGAGISGMQASLDLAEMGFKVYLIDNKSCIGGTMAQLDKTFPTNDCAMCIMSPKLVDTGRHPNVQLHTNTDLSEISGQAGAFHLSLKKKPRFVDELQCNGCGDCAEACPVTVLSEHDEGLGERKAIYRRYPQAIPNFFAIDKAGIPPCRDACPAHVNVQGYIALISAGEYRRAYELIRERHPLPSVCGRICHHPCESACNRAEVDEPVAINYLKRFVADWVLDAPADSRESTEGTVKEEPAADAGGNDSSSPTAPLSKKERVAVVGAGPAGLTAAQDLAAAGYRVTIFEREARPGGALYSAVPGYRLEKEVLFKEVELILRHPNIEIRYEQSIGDKKKLGQLKKAGFAAVFVATGAPLSKDLNIPGIEAEGVLKGVEFLHRVNTAGSKPGQMSSDAEPIRFDGVVTVIGGGNVATDVGRTARRLGAKKVRIVCLESRREMPAYPWEVRESLEEGIEILNGWSPREVKSREGRVSALACARCTSVFDLEGRFAPTVDPEVTKELPTDTLIIAIGQNADPAVLAGLAGAGASQRPHVAKSPQVPKAVATGRGNTIVADPLTLQTGVEWLFAGGDVVSGPASAVEAVAAGHAAAESIGRYLEGKDPRENREWAPPRIASTPERTFEKKARAVMPCLNPRKRIQGFESFELGFDEQTAREEALRCLNCGICSECMLCVTACGREAVKHSMDEQTIGLDAGAVILATGADKFDPSGLDEYGYRKFPNVITSTEFERVLSASGPFSGHVLRPSDRCQPQKVAWVLCAGSRQMKREGKDYCSAVCCMYSIKEAIIAKEHAEGIECHIYYMDIRAYGKDFDAYYERAQGTEGIEFRRARLSGIEEVPGSHDLRVKYVDERDRVAEEIYDLVVLSTGLVSGAANPELSRITGIELNRHGFLAGDSLVAEHTAVAGIFVCGSSSAPRNIPESVTTASACAAYASALLKEERHSQVSAKTYPPELSLEDGESRVGVFVCHCGINIGSVVDVPAVAEYAAGLPGVVYAEANLYTCSQDTQEKIKQAVEERGINRVVVASCTPRTHELLFQDTLREVGLNPFMFEFVGIREQCSWVHSKEKDRATDKAKDLVAMGVSRAGLLSPFRRLSFPVLKKGLVIGGGVAGITAALILADQGFETFLVEREKQLGGNLRDLRYTLDGRDIQVFLAELIERLDTHPLITVFTDSLVQDVSGYVGNYATTIAANAGNGSGNGSKGGGREEPHEIEHGVIIVATGVREIQTQEYLRGSSPAVITQRELEVRLAAGSLEIGTGGEGEGSGIPLAGKDGRGSGAPTPVRTPVRIAMIQCVGSREDERPYCSRICCQTAVKNALKIKQIDPGAQVTIFYRDVRTYGFSEEYYQKAREAGVLFLRYEPEAKPEVQSGAGNTTLLIRYRNLLLGRQEQLEADLLVLSTGMEPDADRSIASILKLPLNRDGFLLEAHAKLRPLDFPTEGIYLCGAAHSPKTIQEAISQAAGAAARAVTLLSKDQIQSSGLTVQINERICAGCGVCVEVCPYEARVINEESGKAEIIEVLCQGCGACATACPNGATLQIGFTKTQVYHMLEEVI
ncbi:MAG: FAD-dependent oxidoreductase [Spirochaetaceae bacterium]|nr:MAG: FAD-dependent oxidoreductase [Spirochaetaceae bacterium]